MTIQRLTSLGALLCFMLWPGALRAAEEKGTYLGALFMSRAQVVPNRIGTAPKPVPAPGVVVTLVLPDSPAARADLRRNDAILHYGRTVIRDGDHLAELIRKDKPDRKVQLLVLRGEKRVQLDVKLALGTVLKPAGKDEDGRGRGNRTGAQVSLWATPLDNGKVNVTVEYYTPEGNRKTFTCDQAAELTTELKKLPDRERNLVRVALQRLKSYSETKKEGETQRPPQKEKK